MADNDIDFLSRYAPGTLYVSPNANGAYGTIVGDSEETVGVIQITPRSKIAVKAFRVKDTEAFGTFKIIKLKFHKARGWEEDGIVHVNTMELSQIREFVAVLSTLVGGDTSKIKISLKGIGIEALSALLGSSGGPKLIQELEASPALRRDIYALASKRKALTEFEALLTESQSEATWQSFFEANAWIFGLGVHHVFLEKVGNKMEAVTTGAAFDKAGKRTDGLMRTRAEISQYVLIEIKKSDTPLLVSEYRQGCWRVSTELVGAVTQLQKSVYEFAHNRLHDKLKDGHGNDTGQMVYSVEPRSFLVIGHQRELLGNDDKLISFELFRRNVRAPEILTFDELYERAKYIIETLDKQDI